MISNLFGVVYSAIELSLYRYYHQGLGACLAITMEFVTEASPRHVLGSERISLLEQS
jgi:hypothetical protein